MTREALLFPALNEFHKAWAVYHVIRGISDNKDEINAKWRAVLDADKAVAEAWRKYYLGASEKEAA